jgi:hypothetical protein
MSKSVQDDVNNSICDINKSHRWSVADLQVGICPGYFVDILWFWKDTIVLVFWIDKVTEYKFCVSYVLIINL